jgi:hypothetical protein
MTNLYVVNQSTLVSDGDVQTMTRACAHQLRYDAAPLFGLAPMPVTYTTKQVLEIGAIPPRSWVISILDDPDQADALGWHTEEQGELIYGRTFARPVLDNGGDALTKELSVASVLSHEVLETFADPHCVLYADSGNGYLVAYEVCDPVESDSYPVAISGKNVMVSNFVTPKWFDPQAARGDQFDFMGNTSEPFEMTSGGYIVEMCEGQVSQKFGEKFPEWKRPLKHADTARAARRAA